MIKSMTGYGKGEASFGGGKIAVEIRSVNHRYGEVFVKLPRNLVAYENDVRKIASERLKRGKIEVFVQLEQATEGLSLAVNIPLAKAYHEALNRLKNELGIAGEITLPLIVSQKDVLSSDENRLCDETLGEALMSAVRIAVEGIESMRIIEGKALLGDLRKRKEAIESLAGEVTARSPLVVSEYAGRLKERLAQLVADSSIGEERLAQEVAIMADRCDITEELVRLGSHLQQFDATLALGEPVGRKLDFLLQEMSREVNTVGAKANDAEIAFRVVEMKTEIEKIREQVQNIE